MSKPFKTLFNGNDDRDRRLLEIFEKACKRFGVPNIIKDYSEHRIPASIPNCILDTMDLSCLYTRDKTKYPENFYKWGEKYDQCFAGFFARDIIIRRCGFVLVTKNLTYALRDFMVKYSKKKVPTVLELGCGSGCLAKGLMDRGINMIPTDSYSWYGPKSTFTDDRMWIPLHEIEKIDMVDAVKKYGEDVDFVLLSWPVLDYDRYEDLVKTMHNINPDLKMLYCGEWYDGCTANAGFFEVVKECDGFNYGIESVNRVHQTWDWIHDYWYLLEYNPASESIEGMSTNDFSDDLCNKLDDIAQEINGVKDSIANINNDIASIKQTIVTQDK